MSENLVLRITSGSKREKVTGAWRKLREELYTLFFSPKIRLIPDMGRTNEIGLGRYFFGKLEWERPLGRPRHK
jgi:hypothetical protein